MILWQQGALALGIAYLLGSIPFGVILTRLAGAGDWLVSRQAQPRPTGRSIGKFGA